MHSLVCRQYSWCGILLHSSWRCDMHFLIVFCNWVCFEIKHCYRIFCKFGRTWVYIFLLLFVFCLLQISYFLMLCCFSFFVLTDVHPVADGQISLTESCIFIWILTLLLEELRQVNTLIWIWRITHFRIYSFLSYRCICFF